MAYPVIYNVTYSYSGFQQSQGNNAFPGTQIDADLQGLRASVNNLDLFSQSVMRSDGALNNGVVTFDSLAPALQTAGLIPAVPWTTATSFLVNISVVQNSALYRCLVAHTSGVFATDLATGKWLLIAVLPAGAGGSVVVNVEQAPYGAKGDTLLYGDGAITTGTGAFSSTLATFKAADVGKTINIAGAGAAGAAYTGAITVFTSAHAVTISPNASTTISGKSFEYGTDDTVAIQMAISAAAGVPIYVPKGNYLAKRLNLTNINNLKIYGDGQFSTRFIPNQADGWSGGAAHFFDTSGSNYVYFEGFSIGYQNGTGQVSLPATGILMSASSTAAQNLVNLKNISVTGQYGVAGVYNNGCASSYIEYCQFFNFRIGANSSTSALMFTSSNAAGLTSSFVTLATGGGPGDWTLVQTEVHSLGNTTGQAAYLDGVVDFRVYGGNWSAGGLQYIRTTGNCARIILSGTSFGTEGDPTVPVNLINATSGVLDGLVDSPVMNAAVFSGARYAGTVRGYPGELVSSSVSSGSAVSLTTSVASNVTSISLTPGKWVISGNVEFGIGGSCTNITACINTVSATVPVQPNSGAFQNLLGSAISNGQAITAGTLNLDLDTAATVYLVGLAGFTTSTVTAYGAISARRVW